MKTSALVQLLAPKLGLEKSEGIVSSSIKRLGLPTDGDLSYGELLLVLDDLGRMGGIVGVVARFIKLRGELEVPDDEVTTLMPSATPPSADLPIVRVSAPDALPGHLSHDDINAFLAPALGDAKGLEAIAVYAAKIGATGEYFTRAQALEILELMAQAEGVLGTVARFAKARFILLFPG
jgi:hypothetical protein